MAKEYRLSIIVSGRDTGAKSMLGGLGSALGSMGTIAGGILAAGVLQKLANGISLLAKTAYDSVGAFQKMEAGLLSLQARELKTAGELDKLNGYATTNLHLTGEEATKLVSLRTSYDNLLPQLERARTMYGEQSTQYQNITSQLTTYEAKILALASSHGNLSTQQQKVVMNQLGMNDALAMAEPLAKKTMDQLQRIAVVSPYEMSSVQSTYQLAMAFGFTSNEATSFTRSMLDMAAGIGAGQEQLDRMSYNLAQIRMQGKVTGTDIRQLAMAGFDLTSVLRYVGRQMCVNIQTHQDFNKAIADGTIKWEDFSKYFAKYAEENFGGAAERMSRTLAGLQSSFHDVFGILLPKIFGKPAERITKWLGTFLDKIMDISESGVLERLGDQLDGFLARFENSSFLSFEWLDQLTGLDVNQQYINTAETPEDQRTARKEIELEPPVIKKKWDPAKILSEIGWSWMDITLKFREGMEAMDWGTMSENLITKIESIDWAAAGNKLVVGVMHILEGLYAFFANVDWGGLFGAVAYAVGDFVTGLFGSNMEEAKRIVLNTLDNLKLDATLKIEEFKQAAQNRFAATVGAVGATFGLLPMFIMQAISAVINQIMTWKTQIDAALSSVAKTFFSRASGWMTQLISGLMAMLPKVIDTIGDIIDQIKGAITGITIPISFSYPKPNMSGNGGTCFAGNTPVLMADGSQKPIAAVQAGDRVTAYDFTTGRRVTANVVYTVRHGPAEVAGYMEINGTLRVTIDHLLWDVEKGWVPAGSLRPGSVLLNSRNEPVAVHSIQRLTPDEPVYNIHIDKECHNYFAGGILAHNAKNGGFHDGGISTGSNRGHWELLHGTEAVIPLKNGSIPVALNGPLSPGGGGGAMVVNVTVNYSPFVTTSDRSEARNKLAPFIADELRLLLPQRL